jgi:hypothetical protein
MKLLSIIQFFFPEIRDRSKVQSEFFPILSVSKVNTLFENENFLSNVSPYLLTKSESIYSDFNIYFVTVLNNVFGARGSVDGWGATLQAAGPRVGILTRSLDFPIDLIFHPRYDFGVDSDSNRNEHKESSLGVKRGRRIRLRTSPLPVSWLSRKCGILDVSNKIHLK